MKNFLEVAHSLSFTQEIEFIGKKNIWIKQNFNKNVLHFGRTLITEALQNTSAGQIEVIGFDNTLSGIFSPFSSFISGEQKILKLLTKENELKDYLDFLEMHIIGVQNTIQDEVDSLIEFRKKLNFSVETYKLVFLHTDVPMLNENIRERLSVVMEASANAGITFVVISPVEDDNEFYPLLFDRNIQYVKLENNAINYNGVNINYPIYTSKQIIDSCKLYIREQKEVSAPTIRFSDINSENYWNLTSQDGLTFSIGKSGMNVTEITIGDEVNQRHNILVTGAVGQGKSNLLSVIIHSLCYRYSPEELELYLLDFKEGVTLKPFAPIDKDDYLVHAKVLGLEADVAFGESVLNHLFSLYKERLKLFKKFNVQNIKKYRELTNDRLPRIVLIIDEFQMMFGDDTQRANKIAELLEKSVRLYRAAGIHIILASQTIGGSPALLGKSENIFSQVPIRIAHKNSLNESYKVLGQNNPVAAYLKPREALVNLDYGEVSQNKKSIIAYADEEELSALRVEWWESQKDETKIPSVFESDKKFYLEETKIQKTKIPRVYLGEFIDIDGNYASIPMINESGRNIAILGADSLDKNTSFGIMQNAIESLHLQGCKDRIVAVDFSGNHREKLKMQGVNLIASDDFQEYIDECASKLTTNTQPLYIFAFGLDKWNYKKEMSNHPPLRKLVESGPNYGIHFIGQWIKASKFKEQAIGFGSNDIFNTKLFLRIDERELQSQTNPFIKWSGAENRALLYDDIEFNDEKVIIPFSEKRREDEHCGN